MMKKLIAKTYHFLGGALFAVFLLFATAVFVAYGTIVESKTGSHQLAMESVYSSLPFRLLLGGFFLNILISALRRYPFRSRHIPFLVTHLGLLVIISGLIVKSFFGLQGMISVRAGSQTGVAIIPEEIELIAEFKEGESVSRYRIPFHKDYLGRWTADNSNSPFTVRIVGSREHSSLHMDSFFKGGFLHLRGLRPMPVTIFEEGVPLSPSGKIKMHQGEGGVIEVIAVKAEEPEAVIREALLDAHLTLNVFGRPTPIFSGSLREAIGQGIDERGIKATLELSEDTTTLNIDYDCGKGEESLSLDLPTLQVTRSEKMPLECFGKLRRPHLTMEPKLLFIKDMRGAIQIVSLDSDGKLTQTAMGPDCEGARFLSYDDGFMGYSVELPLTCSLIDNKSFSPERAALFFAAERLSAMPDHLLPLLVFSTKREEASELLALFQKTFTEEGFYFYRAAAPLPEKVRRALERSSFFDQRKELTRALALTTLLTENALEKANDAKSLKEAFSRSEIPLPHLIDEEDNTLFLGKLSELALVLDKEMKESLPAPVQFPLDTATKAKFLSLLLRLYGLTYHEIVPEGSFNVQDFINREALYSQIAFHFPFFTDLPREEAMQAFNIAAASESASPVMRGLLSEAERTPFFSKELLRVLDIEEADRIRNVLQSAPPYLESTVTFRFEEKPAGQVKGEERAPLFLLDITWKGTSERLLLSASRGGNLLLPFFEGRLKLGIAPKEQDIPYLVRVQDAREIAYPGSSQAEAYESVLYLQDKKTGRVERKEIGLNRVFETDEGYRFFLSSITPSDESDVPEVRLALNYDPSKRLLVFAGSILVALGIVLLYLFTIRKKAKI
ncbi:hypothetical protein [Estrella lausannensis]|uniref:Putative membrane protein n=1 Tax=Estrella lausannensis TaxID=483423 RepID=A0A0H5E7D3_9BACT|nr:hypothetical protein [Estrella lausannensis]CRX39240.1 Putative membrane protein [Estrella lausannensis]